MTLLASDAINALTRGDARLLRTPPPQLRESMMPYALRLAESNGYETPGYLFYTNRNMQRVMSSSVSIMRELVELDESQWQRLRYTEGTGATCRLLGKPIGRNDLQLRRPRVCPECIADHGVADALWDIAWVTACPVHKIQLINRCPACHSELTWYRQGLLKCRCGQDLRVATTLPARDHEIRISALLACKLCDESSPELFESEFTLYEGATLMEVCSFASALSVQLLKRTYSSPEYRRTRRELVNEETLAAFDTLMFADREAAAALFDRLWIDPVSRRRMKSFAKAFKWLMQVLVPDRAAHAFAPVYEKLFLYAGEHCAMTPLRRTSGSYRDFVVDGKWITLAEACSRLGVPWQIMRAKMKGGGVPFQQDPGKATHNTLVPKAWVDAQEAIVRKRVTASVLRRRYALRPAIIAQLRDSGWYVPSAKARFGEILHDDIEAFAETLLARAQHEIEQCPASQVTLCDLMYANMGDRAKAGIIAAVLDGSLIPTGRIRQAGLPGLVFDATDARMQMAVSTLRSKGEVTAHQAAKILECCDVHGLIDLKLLTVSSVTARRFYLSEASIEAFASRYQSPRRILAEMKVTIAALLRSARTEGVELLASPNRRRTGSIWFIPLDRIDALRAAVLKHKSVRQPRQRKRTRASRSAATAHQSRGTLHGIQPAGAAV